MPRPAEIRYPTSDSYPRSKAPSPRGLRPQAVGEFTVMGIFTLSNSSINPNFHIRKLPHQPSTGAMVTLATLSYFSSTVTTPSTGVTVEEVVVPSAAVTVTV